jgi:hypothetical protein
MKFRIGVSECWGVGEKEHGKPYIAVELICRFYSVTPLPRYPVTWIWS